jgi:hypothetical protein
MCNPNPQSLPYLSSGLSASIAHYRYQAKYIDGKSDGKSFFVILFLIFTAKPDLNSLKSLQIKEFVALQIVGPGNS